MTCMTEDETTATMGSTCRANCSRSGACHIHKNPHKNMRHVWSYDMAAHVSNLLTCTSVPIRGNHLLLSMYFGR